MSEGFLTILRGAYWPLFFAALIGAALRFRERKWTAFDTLTGLSFLFLISLTSVLPRLFYGPEAAHTPRRYLFMFIPLYLPFAAYGMLRIRSGLKKRSPASFLLLVLLLIHIGFTFYGTYLPAVKEYSSAKKRDHRILSLSAAEWIRRDWANRKTEKVFPLRYDHYQSGKRPVVDSPLERIGFLSGGQDYSAALRDAGIRPDYEIILSRGKETVPDRYDFRVETPDGTTLFIRKAAE